MDRRTAARFDLLSRGLMLSAAVVLTLSLISAIAISTSDNTLPFFEDLQRESRGIAAIATFGGGLAAAGVLAGLGAILHLLLLERIGTAGIAPAPGDEEQEVGASEAEEEEASAPEAEERQAPRRSRRSRSARTEKRPRER